MDARTRAALRVAEEWLRWRYPPPKRRKVIVRVCKLSCAGSTAPPKNGSIYLSIRSDLETHEAIDTLQHEWAHMLTIDETAIHGRRWRNRHGAIYHHWHDRGGLAEAIREFTE